MFPCAWLVMVTLIPVILSVNPGVEVKLTDKGIEYGGKSCRCFCFCFQVRSCGSSTFSFFQGDNWELLQFRKSSRKSSFQIFQGNREFLQLEKSNTAWQSKASNYKEMNFNCWFCAFYPWQIYFFSVYRSWILDCQSIQFNWCLEVESNYP